MQSLENTIGLGVDLNYPVLFVGRHGTGKSFSVLQKAKEEKKDLVRIVVTGETTPEDLVGMYELKDGETVFEDRPLLSAVQKGKWILIEEINVASPAVLTLLNGLLETNPEDRFITVRNDKITPHESFRLFATMNPSEYSGTQLMNDALLSRFIIEKVEIDWVKFTQIIEGQGATTDQMKDVKAFVSASQKALSNFEVYVSPRELIMFFNLLKAGVAREMAASYALARFYDSEKALVDELKSLFGAELERDEIFILNDTELQKRIHTEVESAERALRARINTSLREKDSKMEDFFSNLVEKEGRKLTKTTLKKLKELLTDEYPEIAKELE